LGGSLDPGLRCPGGFGKALGSPVRRYVESGMAIMAIERIAGAQPEMAGEIFLIFSAITH
jgi:hypothetical protein